ncbi:MAG TPA: hypothetical protein VM936_11880 [Pyrinomonadaceae bacterium]|jgi:hypothetical protein|nr:hypothetical protein [Pyrinomonadaceae bacterium]
MKTSRLKSAARAACLAVGLTLAGHVAAAVGARTTRAAHAPKPCARETVVRGRGLVTLGGYELNVTFTTAGRLVRFDITDAPPA